VLNITPRSLYLPERDPVPIVQEAGWGQGTVWQGAENPLPPTPVFEPRSVHPVASRNTGCTISAATYCSGELSTLVKCITVDKNSISVRRTDVTAASKWSVGSQTTAHVLALHCAEALPICKWLTHCDSLKRSGLINSQFPTYPTQNEHFICPSNAKGHSFCC
jgi:hypothetical protein